MDDVTKKALQPFAVALDELAKAALRLSEEWEKLPAEIQDEGTIASGYPSQMGDFDDVVLNLVTWSATLRNRLA